MSKIKCPICGKEFECTLSTMNQFPRTMIYKEFKHYYINENGERVEGKPLERKMMIVCSGECFEQNENQYIVEQYKGNNIYCVNGRYMPYLECKYWYENIEGVKERIDNPHIVPLSPMGAMFLGMTLRGEL